MKNTLLFTYSTNILVRLLTVNVKNYLTPKSENVRPHSSNSIESATPLLSIQSRKCDPSGTSSLASYKEVPPGPFGVDRCVPIVPGSHSPVLPSQVRSPYKTIQSDKATHLHR